jgi:hypothetical protein
MATHFSKKTNPYEVYDDFTQAMDQIIAPLYESSYIYFQKLLLSILQVT